MYIYILYTPPTYPISLPISLLSGAVFFFLPISWQSGAVFWFFFLSLCCQVLFFWFFFLSLCCQVLFQNNTKMQKQQKQKDTENYVRCYHILVLFFCLFVSFFCFCFCSSSSKNNSSSFIFANLTIVAIVVMTITRSSNSIVL